MALARVCKKIKKSSNARLKAQIVNFPVKQRKAFASVGVCQKASMIDWRFD